MAFTHAHAVCSSYGRGTLPKLIENGIVNRKSFLIEKDVDNPVIHDSISFFSKHAEIVENGTISKALKNLLISGENI